MRLLRRVHLYSGLFMLPWVLLYGVTALLLNHRSAFPDAEVQHIAASDLAGTQLEGLPTAGELAEELTHALVAAQAESGKNYSLLNPAAATYGGKMFLSASGDGQKHSIAVDLDGPKGYVQSKAEQPQPAEAFELQLTPQTNVLEQSEKGLAQLLANKGIRSGDVQLNFAPKMEFQLAVDGRPYHATYDLKSGKLAAQPSDAPSQLSWRKFLVQLHFAHDYPAEWNAAWIWALAVDAMFVSMVFWGGSGVLMWWQIKRTRILGAVILVVSGGVATLLALGMHAMLAH